MLVYGKYKKIKNENKEQIRKEKKRKWLCQLVVRFLLVTALADLFGDETLI